MMKLKVNRLSQKHSAFQLKNVYSSIHLLLSLQGHLDLTLPGTARKNPLSPPFGWFSFC